jgi:hypothetical protein
MHKKVLIECEECGEMYEKRDIVLVEGVCGKRCFCRWCWDEMNSYFVSDFDNGIYYGGD